MPQRKIHSESGNVLLATGLVMIGLLFATLIVSASYYFDYRSQLDLLARNVAGYSGGFLPDVDLAARRATESFAVLKNDLRIEADLPKIPGGQELELKLFVESYDYDPLTGQATAVSTEYKVGQTKIKPPIRSLTAKISANFDLMRLNLVGLNAKGGALVTRIQSSYTTELTPTDVVLVIENSNSIISPLKNEGPDPFIPPENPFTALGPKVGVISTGPDTQYSNPDDQEKHMLSPALVAMRQCFGQRALSFKTAALKIFDALTSSASYRVALIHTLNPSGEIGKPTIDFAPDSYETVYARHRPIDHPLYEPLANALSGKYYRQSDHPESRCAALTTPDGVPGGFGEFTVPAHPLHARFDQVWYNDTFNKTYGPMLNCHGNRCGGPPDRTTNYSQTNHLAFNPNQMALLARDLIWINANGMVSGSGQPLESYNFSPTQIVLSRAFDLLKVAVDRKDKRPVARRIVLLLTDGLERPTKDYKPLMEIPNGPKIFMVGKDNQASVPNELIKGVAGFSTKTFYDPATGNVARPGQIPILRNFCNSSDKEGFADNTNTLTVDTDISPDVPFNNQVGIKLGVVHYNQPVLATNPSDPLDYLAHLPGHELSPSELIPFRAECNTAWADTRGRYLLETATDTPEVELPEKLAPLVIQSIFRSEVFASGFQGKPN